MTVSIEALGVFLTLLYLAYEVRQNNKIAMSNGHREISKQLSEWHFLFKNPKTSSILTRGSLDFSSLTPEEKLEYDTVRHHHYHTCEQIFYMGWTSQTLLDTFQPLKVSLFKLGGRKPAVA